MCWGVGCDCMWDMPVCVSLGTCRFLSDMLGRDTCWGV